ncbi:sensor histidine kinase [Solihabitans fulvus]|uniref:histidine kinase n=1 Tax=Solihabitans fulvus TaxID=1892852 RepID=A0A5B2XBL9_9PSEU|nr:histidine kinase [Solihabitans fulvus]KAA2260431.1 sensor histidine kinase [Solihabitans fulvus]
MGGGATPPGIELSTRVPEWYGWSSSNLPVLVPAALTGLPVLLAARRPLVAWRLSLLLILVTPTLNAFFARQRIVEARLMEMPWTWTLTAVTALVLYRVSERYEPPVTTAVWLLTTVACWLYPHHQPESVLVAIGSGGIVLLGNAVRLRRLAESGQREQENRTAEEQSKSAVLEERARIARELHDVVAHHMSVLAVRADSAPYRLSAMPADVREEFVDLHRTAHEGLTEMRRLLGVLRTERDGSDTAPQPTLAQIDDLVTQYRKAGTSITMATTLGPEPLSAGVALSAYRIVQEALSNAARHAPGATVRVELEREPDLVRIQVRNTAATATATEPAEGRPRHGLVGMRERVSMLGGTLATGPTEHGGFVVTALFPLAGTP